MNLLEIQSLTIHIGGKTVCDDMSLAMAAGQNWVVLGANGSGKTTLLHTMAGLRTPDAGTVLLDGQPILEVPRRLRARRLGVLFQDAEDTFPAHVMETVLIGRHPHLSRWQWEGKLDTDLATTALSDAGLAGFERRQVSTLSGGERRRVGIATLITQNPPISLLDEPTNHLDLHHQIQILELLTQRIQQPGYLNVFVLHDINLALRYCTHGLLLLGNGECLHGELSRIINLGTLERLYHCSVREIHDDRGALYMPA